MRKKSLSTIYNIAKKNKKIIFIGSDLGAGLLDEMKEELPKQFLMEGVSEQSIIGLSAGLALEGFIPFVNTIATFLTRRCFEQIAIDLCLHNLPVKLIANGGGAVYAPLGPTHLSIDDIGILRTLPNIRLGKGGDEIITTDNIDFKIGKAIIKKEPEIGLFVSTGVMTQIALEACQILDKENIICGVLHMHTIKPLDGDAIKRYFPKVKSIITIEEHSLIGGLGSAILEFCSKEMPNELYKISRIGIPDKFADKYGSQKSLLEHWNITSNEASNKMREKLQSS